MGGAGAHDAGGGGVVFGAVTAEGGKGGAEGGRRGGRAMRGSARTPTTGVGREERTSDKWGGATRAQLAGLEKDTVRVHGGGDGLAPGWRQRWQWRRQRALKYALHLAAAVGGQGLLERAATPGCHSRRSPSVSLGASGPRDVGGGGPAHITLRRRGGESAAACIFLSPFPSNSWSPPSLHLRHGADPPQPPELCRRRRPQRRRQRFRVVAAAGTLARGCHVHGRRGSKQATAVAAAVVAVDVLAATPAGGANPPACESTNRAPNH